MEKQYSEEHSMIKETKKNQIVKNLYTNMGFKMIGEDKFQFNIKTKFSKPKFFKVNFNVI